MNRRHKALYWNVYDISNEKMLLLMKSVRTSEVATNFGISESQVRRKRFDNVYKDKYLFECITDILESKEHEKEEKIKKMTEAANKAAEAKKRSLIARFKESRTDYLYFHLKRYGNCWSVKDPSKCIKALREIHGMEISYTFEDLGDCFVDKRMYRDLNPGYLVKLVSWDKEKDKGTRTAFGYKKDEEDLMYVNKP